MHYFSLAPHIFAAQFENSIILLDVKQDAYMSLIEDAADYLRLITSQPFMHKDDQYHQMHPHPDMNLDTLNTWIKDFIAQGFIEVSPVELRKQISAFPVVEGGLREYQWDTQVNWKPFSKASYLDLARAYFNIIKVHRALKKNKLSHLFDMINDKKLKKSSFVPTAQALEKLIAAVDAATILYPKKSYCLAWAATFVMTALQKGWDAKLVIGVQANPFYAHAWAEMDGRVIHDDPQVNQVLAIMCTLPEVK